MEVRPLTPHARALARDWAVRIGVLAVLVAVDGALPVGRAPSMAGFAVGLIAAVLVAAAVTAILYVRNRRLVVTERGLEVFDLLGRGRMVPRSELTRLVGLRLQLSATPPAAELPVACFRGSRVGPCLAGPLWSAEELEETAERLGLRVENEARRIALRPTPRRRLSISG